MSSFQGCPFREAPYGSVHYLLIGLVVMVLSSKGSPIESSITTSLKRIKHCNTI